jgi:tRNA pseudouridine(38-40) synthase
MRTVEGDVREGLQRSGVWTSEEGAELAVASRTDRGVSARANALVLSSDLPGRALLRAVNGGSPDIWFTAAAPVDDDFRVRRAVRRTYRYFDAEPVRHPSQREAAARLFSGTIDARSFGRGLTRDLRVERTVESMSSTSHRGGSIIEVTAPSFVWGMVRKMVAAVREVDAGRLTLSALRAAVEGRTRLTLPMAEPEPLVLWNVEYPVRWEIEWNGPNRHQARYIADQLRSVSVRADVLDALVS